MKKEVFTKYVPLALLGLLILIGLITVFTKASDYGLTIDEGLQDQYGHSILKWYTTFGKDTSFLTAYNPNLFMPEHGGIFDGFVAGVQHLTKEQWHTRAVVNGLAGVIGIIAIALCGFEIAGYWGALLAAVGLWLYPRYYGAIFNNPKDIPAAVTMTFALWAVLLLVKQWSHKKKYIINSMLVGFFIGLAAAIRVNAIIWYAMLALPLGAWWIFNGKRALREKKFRTALLQQGSSAALIGIISLLTMMAFWPYIFLNPFANLYNSVQVISHYPINGPVLYDGKVFLISDLPRTYALKWLYIGSPPSLLLFAALGVAIACIWSVKKKALDPKIAMVILSLVAPLGAIIVLHSTLYDALRQFLFIVPPIILLAAYGLVKMFSYLVDKEQRLIAAGLVVLALASYGLVIKDMVDLYPYEYTYFSPLVGGFANAGHQFESDYWLTCDAQAAEWLAQNYTRYTVKQSPTVEANWYAFQVSPYLPGAFKVTDQNNDPNLDPDFFISGTRNQLDQQFPAYKVIHTVEVQGVRLCTVKAKA